MTLPKTGPSEAASGVLEGWIDHIEQWEFSEYDFFRLLEPLATRVTAAATAGIFALMDAFYHLVGLTLKGCAFVGRKVIPIWPSGGPAITSRDFIDHAKRVLLFSVAFFIAPTIGFCSPTLLFYGYHRFDMIPRGT